VSTCCSLTDSHYNFVCQNGREIRQIRSNKCDKNPMTCLEPGGGQTWGFGAEVLYTWNVVVLACTDVAREVPVVFVHLYENTRNDEIGRELG